jgi:hypothetical protein
MSSQPVHSFFGTPLDEWIECTPNELEFDAIGLWQIIPDLRKSFGLSGDALEHATREVLTKILDRGAHPIVGSFDKPGTWERVTKYGENSIDIVNAIVAEWCTIDRNPDVEDVWFGLPRFYDAD